MNRVKSGETKNFDIFNAVIMGLLELVIIFWIFRYIIFEVPGDWIFFKNETVFPIIFIPLGFAYLIYVSYFIEIKNKSLMQEKKIFKKACANFNFVFLVIFLLAGMSLLDISSYSKYVAFTEDRVVYKQDFSVAPHNVLYNEVTAEIGFRKYSDKVTHKEFYFFYYIIKLPSGEGFDLYSLTCSGGSFIENIEKVNEQIVDSGREIVKNREFIEEYKNSGNSKVEIERVIALFE